MRLTEAYRNIIPPSVYPVVLLFLEMPAAEVDVNVHPSKTEVRFRQQTVMHDFVRDSVRAALMKARPVPQFMTEIRAHATASSGADAGRAGVGAACLTIAGRVRGANFAMNPRAVRGFALQAPVAPPVSARFQFEGGIAVEANAAIPVARGLEESIRGSDSGSRLRSGARSREEEPTLSVSRDLAAAGTDSEFVHPRGE